MSKYAPLKAYLSRQVTGEVAMTFAEIEAVLGFKLPASAYKYPAWWANDEGLSHVQAKAWLAAGYEAAKVDVEKGRLAFSRMAAASAASGSRARMPGFADARRGFAPGPEEEQEMKHTRHPAAGALKGTFTIAPGYDLTAPGMDEDEIAEMEVNLDRTIARIEQGMSRKNK